VQSEKTNPYTRNVVRHPVIVVLVALLAFSACGSGLIPWKYRIGAMSNDDPDKINTILSRGYDVNRLDISGQTALMVAAFRGHVETVKLLLDRGADVNVRDRSGATALMYAAFLAGKDNPRQKCPEIIDLLVNQGADVNAVDKRGTTPLMFAAAHRETELARRMIQHGADTKAKNANGVTAGIFYALRFDDPGEVATVEMLGGQEVACPPDVAVLFLPAYDIYLGENFPSESLAGGVNVRSGSASQIVYSRSLEWEYERAAMWFLRPRTYHFVVGYSKRLLEKDFLGRSQTITGKFISIPFEPQEGHVYILRYAFDEINGKSTWRAWIDEIPITPSLDRRDTDN
jgi:hypothetical protein